MGYDGREILLSSSPFLLSPNQQLDTNVIWRVASCPARTHHLPHFTHHPLSSVTENDHRNMTSNGPHPTTAYQDRLFRSPLLTHSPSARTECYRNGKPLTRHFLDDSILTRSKYSRGQYLAHHNNELSATLACIELVCDEFDQKSHPLEGCTRPPSFLGRLHVLGLVRPVLWLPEKADLKDSVR